MRALPFWVAALLLTQCALRPRYADLIDSQTPGPVKLRLIETKSGMPVAGALIEVGPSRNKISRKTDAEGFFSLPVDQTLIAQSPMIIITAPAGVGQTKLVLEPPTLP